MAYTDTIFIDDIYVYNSVTGTLNIYLVSTNAEIASVNYNYEINCIWSNSTTLFFGTTSSGVWYLDKDVLSNFPSNEDVYNSTFTYKAYPDINSNSIRHISGKDNFISICTTAGLDFFKMEPNGYRSNTMNINIYHSYILSERILYYTVSGTESWGINKIDPISDWATGTLIFDTIEGAPSLINNIYGIKATISSAGTETLFLTTDAGVCVLDVYNMNFLYIN